MTADFSNPFRSTSKFRGKRLHLGITGSVSAYKLCDLARQMLKIELSLTAVLTEAAQKFVTPLLFSSLGVARVYEGMFEDDDIFAHLAPGQGAHCFLVAPATANIMAKLACGLADDQLSAQFLAFEGSKVIAPAMNPRMWRNAATQANVDILAKRGITIISPGNGDVACGETGVGRLASLSHIFLYALKSLTVPDLAGHKIMATLGPTREHWDEARFWSNPSSGIMGCALCTAAWLRGAHVYAVCGPIANLELPPGINIYRVETAREMAQTVAEIWPRMDMGLFSAAVADFRPQERMLGKFKKEDIETLEIQFARNPDILLECAGRKREGQKILAFAAEAIEDIPALRSAAKSKLCAKKADLLAANMITGAAGAFSREDSQVVVVDKYGNEELWPLQSKADTAWDLLTWLLKL